ncbi:MAG: chitobiase/beta-hexosaminidase C-terminal domain-containing protein [bacterium]
MNRLQRCAVAFMVFGAAVSGSGATELDPSARALLKDAPVLHPQPDGVVCLNAEAAAILKWQDKHAALVNNGGGQLRLNPKDHAIAVWNGDSERPYWKLDLPQAGRYRVVINRATNTGRESSATLSFWGKNFQSVARSIDSTGGWNIVAPFEMGEVNLDAGEQIVEYRPTAWVHSLFLIHLVDIRLIPLDPMRQLERSANDILTRMGINQDPAVQALAARQELAARELEPASEAKRRKDFSQFSDYTQFLTHDRLDAQFPLLEAKEARLRQELKDLKIARLKALPDFATRVKPEEMKTVQSYFDAVDTLLAGATRPYALVYYDRKNGAAAASTPAATRGTLLPTGQFSDLPRQEIDSTLPQVELSVGVPSDAASRRENFAHRNDPEALASLCRDFQRVLVPGTPGLEEFERLCKVGKYRAALDAYRAYFFTKLKNRESDGSTTDNIAFAMTMANGKGDLLQYPSALALEKNLHDAAVSQIGREVVVANVGAPGAVLWAPTDLTLPPDADTVNDGNHAPFWQTPAGKVARKKIEFYRTLHRLPSNSAEYKTGGLFNALLFSYAVRGNKMHLQRWCDYMDDWTMNARRDQDASAIDVRQATELETQQIRCTLTLWRIILDEQPTLARDFDSATLVRLLMKLTEDYAPYTIRAHRAEMANWAVFGISEMMHVSRFLHEFQACTYFNRECWRMWSCAFIQNRTLDGENFEAWDQGHNPIDVEWSLYTIPYAALPADADRFAMTEFWDHVKNMERNLLTHISPCGDYWPQWATKVQPGHNTLADVYLRPPVTHPLTNPPDHLDLIKGEPGARSRIDTIMSAGKPADTPLPDRTSDIAPYAAMYYLRDSWQPDADYLLMQNFIDRSQGLDDCARTMYSVSKGRRVLANIHSLAVDGKPDNRYYGKLRTGGKTSFCGQAGRHVVDTRFHTSARFDLAEARQDAPYATLRVQPWKNVYGLYQTTGNNKDDPAAITDVTTVRQVFAIRGENLYLVSDRIQSTPDKNHEYTQFLTLPVRIEEAGLSDRVRLFQAAGCNPIEVNAAARRIRTANPGFDNISLYFCGDSALAFANVLNGQRAHVTLEPPLQRLQKALQQPGINYHQVMESYGQYPVSVRWIGKGNQSLVTVICTRPPASDLTKQFDDDLREMAPANGVDGVAGCRAVTHTGTEVLFQSGPHAVNSLSCGPVTAKAEALLVVRKPDGQTSGIVLGAGSLTVNGQPMAVGQKDFEFTLPGTAGSPLQTIPIHRPIDTVRILPEQSVFTESIQVSFDIPTQKTDDIEFRYTLDGSDPTLQSQRFEAPFTLTESALVKVRPFRKGLKDTPWHFTGTDCGKTIAAVFRKSAPWPAVASDATKPGLTISYFEDAWPKLFAYAGIDGALAPKASGDVAELLNPRDIEKLRATDRGYAVRYEGLVKIPKTGVYSFYAPVHLYTATMDAGYDLRVFIDGKEWFPSPTLHAENIWDVALQAGLHRIEVSYVDYRWKTFRNEYWMTWQEEEMWQGTPVLELSGPGIDRQPIPAAWLYRASARERGAVGAGAAK